MDFLHPEWFALIPALVFIGWWRRGLRLWRPLRVVCLALLTLVLTEPQIDHTRPGLELWVLVDQSDSARPLLHQSVGEWLHLLENSRGRDDSLRIIDFAGEARERIDGGTNDDLKVTTRTDIPLAVQIALAGRDARRSSRILLLSDGYSTEPLAGMGEQLLRAGMPLFYRLPAIDLPGDTRLEKFLAPTRLLPGEPLLLEFEARGQPGRTVSYRLSRNDEAVATNTFTFNAQARAQFRIVDKPPTAGSHRYRIDIQDAQDAFPGNNSAETWVMIDGGPRIVLLSPYTNDPVATALGRAGIPVQLINDFSTLNAGTVIGAQAVLLNNVPAHVLPTHFLQTLRFYVTEQGGSLAMIGGKHSFGSGGYFESPVDDILPVSMELKEDHKKLVVAMAIVLDRSGSMSMQVSGGKTKMDMANAGAADTVQLMGGYDAVTVFAVDSEAHRIVPLTAVKDNQEAIASRIRSISSMGGGIYVYTGMKAAWEELKKSQAGQKHIILFADANDAEEPGRMDLLLAEMAEAGATVSVIGLGDPLDADGEFLMQISLLGGGRIFFSEDPATLPALFAQETVAVSRSAFIADPVGMQPTADWLEISPQPVRWPEAFDGYNLSYLRPRAASALNTTDEYQAPLLAFWRRGSGRAAAVTFPLSGPDSTLAREWEGYGDFIQTLARWLIEKPNHRDLGLRTRLEGSSLALDLFYNDDWAQQHADSAPVIIAQQLGSAQPQQGVWERIRPGHYRTHLPLSGDQPYLGAVQWGEASLPFGPFALQRNPEWETPPHMLHALREAAQTSNGGQLNLLETIWQAPQGRHAYSLRLWLLALLAVCVIVEAGYFRWSRH